jgi:hypothetical protein
MSRFTPQKAVRKGQKARVAFAGPSGSGKTWTALEVAKVLDQPVLVIDTERGSASLYSDFFEFDVIEWEPPYDPRELGLVVAENDEKYGTIVVDSLSHFWSGEGGTLAIVDSAAARAKGNKFAGWKEGTPAQDDMVTSLLNARCHVIATMRSKTEYATEDKDGKSVPRKIGLAPIQRDGLEYEFTVTGDLDLDHTLTVDKSRCRQLTGKQFTVGKGGDFGRTLAEWLSTAEAFAADEDVLKIATTFDKIDDLELRKAAKALFKEKFGVPDHLLAKDVKAAQKYADELASKPKKDAQPALTGDAA